MVVILVTGCAGFIGSHVSEKLLNRGDTVIGIDEINDYYDISQKENNLEILQKYENFIFYKADINDNKVLGEIFDKYDIGYIAHIAARAGVRPSIEDPFIYEHSNIKGTLNILNFAKKYKDNIKNVVITSSSSVYGNRDKVPFSENDRVDFPISPYAMTKKCTEEMAFTYHHLYGLNINIIRPFTIYGPRGRPDMAPYLFVKWIMDGVSIKKFGDGSSKRDYTYIDDFVDGFVNAIDRAFGYEIFNLGNSNPVTLNEFIETVEKITGNKALINQQEMQPGDVAITYADTAKAKKLLGYEPKVKIDEGLKRFYEWYKDFKNL